MTTLDAVNEILAAVGIRPVPALETGGNSLAAEAERILDRESLRIQSDGWGYNLREGIDIEPDGSGYIVLPDDVIWADAYDTDATVDVAVTGNRLFNIDENTDVFDETITVRYCVAYEFECIPYPVRQYIMAAAKYQFARTVRRELRLEGSVIAEIREDMLLALTAARQYDSDSSNDNMLDTDANYRVRGNRGAVVR